MKNVVIDMSSQLKVFLDTQELQDPMPLQYMKTSLEEKSRILLNDPQYFFIFMLSTIFGVLIYYRATVDEILPTIVLSLIWVLFWKNTDQKGRIFLVIAAVFGYVHELLGVSYGYFTYLGGFIGGSPIWLIPGYGTIFWSSYNLWEIFERTYSERRWFRFTNIFIPVSLALLIAIDHMVFDLALKPLSILAKFTLALMLFRTFEGIRLAYFVAFFTVLTELTGEMIGTWTHPEFSLISLMAGYVFLLWVCLTINDASKGRISKNGKEVIAGLFLTTFYIFLLLGSISV
ncbi:hypothetical protein [Methanolobus profundi]|uniref:Uncharacterized protein n=1 Tax=Methanolobus profundi TaxID=487685 RepID=A0A1I4PUR3_9EURY|nr:hypothetical protein [Methanolobus profundi]SFM31316.1 hypothetical protein SAMN04488696_0900 [Methanolobus profundi]